jgi:hypothetical protein
MARRTPNRTNSHGAPIGVAISELLCAGHNPWSHPYNDPKNLRFTIYYMQDDRLDYENPEPIQPCEIPKMQSMSGWMRNEREANEYIQRKGA